MEKIRTNAAGIDIGSKQVFVSLEGGIVKSFETFTSDLESLSRYLKDNGVTTVAMEATGSYWYVLYDILAAAGIDA